MRVKELEILYILLLVDTNINMNEFNSEEVRGMTNTHLQGFLTFLKCVLFSVKYGHKDT